MPELPEVETTKRHLCHHVAGHIVQRMIVRHRQLRWPVPNILPSIVNNHRLHHIGRRGKYLLLYFKPGTLIIHLGMSGYIRLLPPDTPPKKHEHADLIFDHMILRFCDPRRFGAIIWTSKPPQEHHLLSKLGPEPLSRAFTGAYLYKTSQRRKISVKLLLMNNQVVTGIGNIYANEIIYRANIHPLRPANTLDKSQCQTLAKISRQVLRQAIQAGGTTIKDFQSNGAIGYFQQQLHVYGRQGLPCHQCSALLTHTRLNGRITVFCEHCQH